MKKLYLTPFTEEVRMANGDELMAFTDINAASNPGGPGTQTGGIPAAQRMSALGNTTVKSNLGTLGSTGSIRSVGTLK